MPHNSLGLLINFLALATAFFWQGSEVPAQSAEWKVIACTVENPDRLRGAVLTVYFSDSGRVNSNGTQRSATVTSAEIRFCNTPEPGKDKGTCFNISQISGRFSAALETAVIAGTCVPGGDRPKF